MTCIVGVVSEGDVFIGGDSAGSSGWSIVHRADQKVWAKDGYVFGFTTSFRMGQLLRHALDLPRPPWHVSREELERFMVTTFIDAVRGCLKEGGFAQRKDEVERGGEFLVGVEGRLFKVSSDYQVGESLDGYAAAGCGEEVALGALYAQDSMGVRPAERIEKALAAAAHHSNGVAAPFVVAVGESS
ncbi:hypothetical protein ASD11_01335 [Aeromicrobium sp. Root495]|uniref:hypothetical protein n=1 Tax=Aeromicrobium sp. Root495 TaxID=1736550 RepID=UPI0006F47323|nr:hypothetical protein [Aeromicrobium sp. Root495]KQY58338.1 hypothetical protein ASD11_01335 [Aeromicrobium sp. Root495]